MRGERAVSPVLREVGLHRLDLVVAGFAKPTLEPERVVAPEPTARPPGFLASLEAPFSVRRARGSNPAIGAQTRRRRRGRGVARLLGEHRAADPRGGQGAAGGADIAAAGVAAGQ